MIGHHELKLDTIHHGDSRDILPAFPPDCIDLVVTSPPYADSRKNTYGGISPDEYVDWFLPKKFSSGDGYDNSQESINSNCGFATCLR